MDLSVTTARMLRPTATTEARLSGQICVQGWADDPHATGVMEISPLARGRIYYRLSFTAQNRRFILEGWKSVRLRHPLRSMTVLPFTLYDADDESPIGSGRPLGSGTVHFSLATIPSFLASFRFPRGTRPASEFSPRWAGERGRTEVWYTTATHPESGNGLWLHHELVSPTDGSPPYAHGWVAHFPARGPIEYTRFGPEPWHPTSEGFAMGRVSARPGKLTGSAGAFSWDLAEQTQGAPIFTFPRWSWRHSLLPAAQMLPAARAYYTGTFTHPSGILTLDRAPGASARIYGHGNARRWAWLHADLGDGDVLEIVAAVSTRPGLRALPPLVFLRLRRQGRTWPRRAERSAIGWAGLGRFRAEIATPTWTVTGRAGLRRIHVEVTLPADRTLSLDYADPDGSPATCRNSERADANIRLERWRGGWQPEASWSLDSTAHAEVGDR
ncbi:hypothetical protein [Streptomyces sp. NPDC088748]|uniref:hypothetical protein n=1 Tax=Streptomyces sp. NPDC088748 TaxID=3365887 RepID=UPI0038049903